VSREELERLGADFRFVEHTTAVVQGIRFVTGLDPAPENRPNDSRLFLDINGELIPDRMPDDASLLLETESGPVLVFGCAHAGPVNILDHVKNDLGVNRLTAVLGGTHLMFYGSRALEEFVAKVRELGVSLVGVSHCTGLEPALRLARELGDAFTMAAVGRVFEF
jgi:7,8-dihydropterin-6-yl-methyl-4-(beta-D-ribofuranosyl)aminobenzene 5'-phosphate synthase